MRLIDADALLQSEIERCGRVPSIGSGYNNEENFGRILDQAPTIDPESLRPKGRWVDPKWNDMWQSMTATCSHCLERGEVRVRTNEHGMKVINSPSCPHCSAKMEVE